MRNILLLSLFLLGMLSAQAQVYLGAKIGGNYSNINGIHENSEGRFAAQIGLLGFVGLNKKESLFLQTELNYSQQGEYNRVWDAQGRDFKQKIFLDYINIPLLLKWYPLESNRGFFVTGGPYIAFRTAKEIDHYHFETLADENSYKNFDAGGMIGAGISLNKNWEFFVRYSLGVLSQIENPQVHANTVNSVVHLGVSYSINVTVERWFQKSCKF